MYCGHIRGDFFYELVALNIFYPNELRMSCITNSSCCILCKTNHSPYSNDDDMIPSFFTVPVITFPTDLYQHPTIYSHSPRPSKTQKSVQH